MPKSVSPEETYHCLLQWSIIDIRPKDRYEQNHIQGARWMSADHAVRVANEKFEKNEKFVLYDDGGEDRTAQQVAEALEAEGFTGISVLQGGYLDWMRHKYPNKSVNEPTPYPRARNR